MYTSDEEIIKFLELPNGKEKHQSFMDCMDGQDYGQGKLEDLESSVCHIQRIVASLLIILETKNHLTKNDILSILSQFKNLGWGK